MGDQPRTPIQILTKPSVGAWVCYLLRCADGTYYCGVTNDLDKRLAAHNAGEGAKYTRGRTPVRLAHVEACADRSTALKREMEIKQLTRGEKHLLCNTSFRLHGVPLDDENP